VIVAGYLTFFSIIVVATILFVASDTWSLYPSYCL